MAAVQLVCAKIGLVTGRGLAGVLREHYPRWLLYSAVIPLFAANTINVGADLGAIAAAINLLVPALPIPLPEDWIDFLDHHPSRRRRVLADTTLWA